MPADLPGILLLSELYPPTIGGSGVLLESLYTRLANVPVQVLTGGARSRMQNGLQVTAMPMSAPDSGVVRPASLRRHLRVAWAVRAHSSRDTTVHCCRGLPEGLSAWLSGRRFVCWTHGEELGYISTSRELSWLLRRVYRRAAALVANSHNSARLLVQWGVEASRVLVVQPGVDAERFRPDVDRGAWRARHAPAGELLLLSVGRLQRRKGHDLVIAALARLPSDVPPVRYLIAGDGDQRAALDQQARSLGVQNRVVFLGAVSDSDLPALYAASDLFVMPNRQDGVDFEGFGIVFLEAAAAGLPAIGGTTGGAPEAVEDGQSGLLVSGTDPEELARAIARLTRSAEERRRMGGYARLRVLREFTWERGARQLTALHSQLAGAPRHG